MTARLSGKVALVVGAARGIGRGIAERFAEEGARLILADTDAECAGTAGVLGATFVETDVTSLASLQAAVATALDLHGRLDIVVQNAGIYPWQLIEDTSESDWDKVMAVNLRGCFNAARAALLRMTTELRTAQGVATIGVGAGFDPADLSECSLTTAAGTICYWFDQNNGVLRLDADGDVDNHSTSDPALCKNVPRVGGGGNRTLRCIWTRRKQFSPHERG